MSAARLILCEGADDEAFFRHLLEERNLAGFKIDKRPKDSQGNILGGNTVFASRLEGLKAQTGIQQCPLVLIVSDNDEDPESSFGAVVKQVKEAGGWGVPQKPRQIVPSTNDLPPVAILMLPWDGQKGNLETICLISAVDRRRRLAKCLKLYLACVGVDGWGFSHVCKLRMRCLLAAACSTDPNTGIQYAFGGQRGRPKDLIPLKHRCFNKIVKYLKEIS